MTGTVHRSHDAPTVEIYCDREHSDRRYVVCRLARMPAGWVLLSPWKHAEIDDVPLQQRRQREDILVRLDGRLKWNLVCEHCGETVPVKDERLQPILDALDSAGVPSVSLRGLRSSIQSSETP